MSERQESEEGRVFTIRVEKVVPGGRGFARVSGRPAFVSSGIPGDTLEVLVKRDHGSYIEVEPVRVVAASELRREEKDVCPHALQGECGGCDWARVRGGAERSMKTGLVLDALGRIGKIPDSSLPELRFIDSPLQYRLRTRLHLDGLARLGFHAPFSHDVCDIASCEVLSPTLFSRVAELRARLAGIPALSGAEIRILEDQTGGKSGLSLEVPGSLRPEEISSRLDGIAETLEIRGTNGQVLFESGPRQIQIQTPSASFSVSPRSFFQANRFLLEPFLDEIRTALREAPRGKRLRTGLDLYAGCGFLTRPLVEALPRTVAVESDPVSSFDLTRNLEDWEREFERPALAVRKTAEDYVRNTKEKPEAVIVDPPRAGMSDIVRDGLVRLRPELLIYVSCDPATLARDLRQLLPAFTIRSVSLLNLFPSTHHVETVVSLARAARQAGPGSRD